MADLTFGASPVTRTQIDQQLAGVQFPVKALVQNQLPFSLALPNANKLFLKKSGEVGASGEFVFDDKAMFVRFVADVQATAALHKSETGVRVTFRQPPAKTSSKTTKAADSAKSE